MHSIDTSAEQPLPHDPWPVFGHASPRRITAVHGVPGETLPVDTVDQDFEEHAFE